MFYDIKAENVKLQVMADLKYHKDEDSFVDLHDKIKRGDMVGFKGHPTRTKTGELSIIPIEVILLTPCLKMLPGEHFGLKDQETR